MRNEASPIARRDKMCLFEKEKPNPFLQGGTYDQYHRWIGEYPDLFHICPLDAFLVWRGRADGCASSEARRPDQDR